MEEYPESATRVGYPGQNDRWMDDSPAGIARRKKHLTDTLAALKAIPRNELPASEQLNFDIYLELLETAKNKATSRHNRRSKILKRSSLPPARRSLRIS